MNMAIIDTSKVTIPKGFFEDLNVPKLLEWLNSQPTADVVPRDEVERIENEIFDNVKKIAQNAIDHFEKHAERAKSAYAASACHSNAIGAEVVLTEIAKYERRFKKKYTKGGEQK
jgi:ribosome-binding ATPase YchF (GTP1/OBG family)